MDSDGGSVAPSVVDESADNSQLLFVPDPSFTKSADSTKPEDKDLALHDQV